MRLIDISRDDAPQPFAPSMGLALILLGAGIMCRAADEERPCRGQGSGQSEPRREAEGKAHAANAERSLPGSAAPFGARSS